MATVNVYLTFDGNCEEAFNFYKSVFGGEFPYMGRFNDMPVQEGMPQMDETAGNKIMHVSLPISKETCLMGSDTGEEWGSLYRPGNNYAVSINAANKAEADHLFKGLSEDGQITVPINESFWGVYFGMFTDKFGINWMVNYEERPMAEESK